MHVFSPRFTCQASALFIIMICHVLPLGRTMTNLDSIIKSRDITLPTKVHLVKAIVFPLAMCGCEIWTIKKAECQRIDIFNCGAGEDS